MAAAGLCLTSCESMDLVPKMEGNTESWYTTETELNLAANDFYILGYWQEPLISSEQWTDNTTYRQQNRNPGSNGTVLDGTLNGQQYEVYALWQQSYKLIARCNTMLENIHKAEGNVAESVINRYKGEAYFCRACKYADLTFFYGDVPYMDRTMTIDEAEKMGRRDKDEVKELTYADFDKAIEYLPESYGVNEEIHATKGAALAMKARYALYMHDYDIAEDAAKRCIDLGLYELLPKLLGAVPSVYKERVGKGVLPAALEGYRRYPRLVVCQQRPAAQRRRLRLLQPVVGLVGILPLHRRPAYRRVAAVRPAQPLQEPRPTLHDDHRRVQHRALRLRV